MSLQSGPVYAGAALAILERQAQIELNENENIDRASDRFLEVEMFQSQPLTAQLRIQHGDGSNTGTEHFGSCWQFRANNACIKKRNSSGSVPGRIRVALRQFPQLHTNPVNVIVASKSIRASRSSARWCEETIHLLWTNRQRSIAEPERAEARQTYDRAIARYRKIAAESSIP